jgi:hypothetical protein
MLDAHVENELLDKAIRAFHNQTDLTFDVETREFYVDGNLQADALLRLDQYGVNRAFAAEIKKIVTQATLGGAIHRLRLYQNKGLKGLLIADYVNPNIADQLKEMNIAFIDTVGNAFINEQNIYVFIKGNKPEKQLRYRQLTRALQPTGLKVLFALLCNPTLINAPYRHIAKTANVALGTVGWVITDLRAIGYLAEKGKHERKLIQKDAIIKHWVEAYIRMLRPKLLIGRYKAKNYNWWENVTFDDYKTHWGGEIAAAKITRYLQPELATVYTHEKLDNFLIKNRLRKDPNGNVEIRKKFWNFDFIWHDPKYDNLVPPLLIYADLLVTGDARNLETANIIYEQFLN